MFDPASMAEVAWSMPLRVGKYNFRAKPHVKPKHRREVKPPSNSENEPPPMMPPINEPASSMSQPDVKPSSDSENERPPMMRPIDEPASSMVEHMISDLENL